MENIIIEEKENMYILIAKENYMLHFIEDKGYTDENGEYVKPLYSNIVYVPKNADYTLYEAIKIEEE